MNFAERVVGQARLWHEAGRPVVIATIARVRGSSSRPLGSRMAITDGGEFVGYVSGGCVESDVCEHARRVLSDSASRRLHYKQAGDSVFEIGLNCEGQIDVVLELLTDSLLADLTAGPPSVRVTGYRDAGEGTLDTRHLLLGGGSTAPVPVASEVATAAETARETGLPGSTSDADGWRYLVEPVNHEPTLLIVSASSVAHPLCGLGKTLGYRVVISDPREAYLSSDRFPDADLLLPVWPRELPNHMEFGQEVAVVSLNHEPRFEDDLFRMLQSQPPVVYIGAIGKHQRQVERIGRQSDEGYDLALLPTIHTPIGLDLGGKSPEEIALAILAEIQAVRHGRSGA